MKNPERSRCRPTTFGIVTRVSAAALHGGAATALKISRALQHKAFLAALSVSLQVALVYAQDLEAVPEAVPTVTAEEVYREPVQPQEPLTGPAALLLPTVSLVK